MTLSDTHWHARFLAVSFRRATIMIHDGSFIIQACDSSAGRGERDRRPGQDFKSLNGGPSAAVIIRVMIIRQARTQAAHRTRSASGPEVHYLSPPESAESGELTNLKPARRIKPCWVAASQAGGRHPTCAHTACLINELMSHPTRTRSGWQSA